MNATLAVGWRDALMRVVGQSEEAERLKLAATEGQLGEWTTALTRCVVSSCREMGWVASAIGHKANLLPVDQSEYLAVDVMAFNDSTKRWPFPIAVAELENGQTTDRIAYSLWKVLAVRAELRVVFCYRRQAEDGPTLIRLLEADVIQAMGLAGRTRLGGETLVVVGTRSEAEYFPYGFFKWWQLDLGTGRFRIMP